jgi:PAS domain S-box-containing protein
MSRSDRPGEVGATSVTDQRLSLALEAAQLGTWTWDMAAGVTTWDVRLEELHGLPPGGFGGTFEDWLASLHPEDRAECLARVERALADPGPYILLHRTIWADGSVHHIECRGTVIVDDDRTPIGTTGVAMDVTQREHRQAAVTEALVRERELVDVLQQALLPAQLPNVPGATIAARYVAAAGPAAVGGDWYAVLPLAGDRLGLAIGDVAGHGLPAVADMAAVRFSLRALALDEPAPDRVLERLNHVVSVFASGTMITTLYGVLDPKARTWTYASAGHLPALVRNPDGSAGFVDAPCDPPLGVATSFHCREAVMEPRATIVLYTDGLVERRTESISVGLDRLRQATLAGPRDPDGLCAHLADVMLRDTAVSDDVAIVAVTLE